MQRRRGRRYDLFELLGGGGVIRDHHFSEPTHLGRARLRGCEPAALHLIEIPHSGSLGKSRRAGWRLCQRRWVGALSRLRRWRLRFRVGRGVTAPVAQAQTDGEWSKGLANHGLTLLVCLDKSMPLQFVPDEVRATASVWAKTERRD